jgi:D-tyrosyl-tRNA(Tyr) deacylase
MRAVVTRVTNASVSVDGAVVGELPGPGMLVLIGVTHADDQAKAVAMATKIAGLRVLEGEKSAIDVDAPLLVVSQFTLYGDTRKGRRPSWSAAAPGPVAEPLVDMVVKALRDNGLRVATGKFGSMMKVASVNDGPFTVLLEI